MQIEVLMVVTLVAAKKARIKEYQYQLGDHYIHTILCNQ